MIKAISVLTMQVTLVLLGGFLAGCKTPPAADVPCPQKVFKYERRETGRTIVFKKSDFIRGVSGKSYTLDALMLKQLGATHVEQLPIINGFVFTPMPGARLALSKLGQKSEWVVQPEYEYSISQVCQRVTPIPCPVTPGPGPGPSPGPTPNPTPNPTPAPGDRSWGLAAVNAGAARAALAQMGATGKVKVGVLDSGIDRGHPCNPPVFYERDFTGRGSVQDGNGHGTHVAGTIGGGCGVGVAYGYVEVAVGKSLTDGGSGTTGGLAAGMVDLCNQGIKVLSNSWGGGGSDPAINQATDHCVSKGVIVVFAAGNDSGPVNNPAKQAGTKRPKVRAVAASQQSGTIAGYSSRGPEITDIAPGSSIVSNWTRSKACPTGNMPDNQCRIDGTSMATPAVSAICALGILAGKDPCIDHAGTISGYPKADALAAVQ